MTVINCRHHRGPHDCGLGHAADELCLRGCPSRVPIVLDTPGCYPTLPPRPLPVRATPSPVDPPRRAHKPVGGPGTELTKLLGKLGMAYSPRCSCKSRAAEMDARGPDWCAANVDAIVGWLAEEAERQAVPFVAWLARKVVGAAIERARAANP